MNQITRESLQKAFTDIDTDHDGFINQEQFQASKYYQQYVHINDSWQIPRAFTILEDKMTQQEFVEMFLANQFKLIDLAIAKFQISKNVSKYIGASAPSGAGAGIKQSYLKLKIRNESYNENNKQHSISVEAGVDKRHQEKKIEEITKALGHKPHEIFLVLKFKTVKNGKDLEEKLQVLVNTLKEFAVGVAPELQSIINSLRISCKYSEGYLYLVIELDSYFFDSLVKFANEVIIGLSPDCDLTFKARLASDVSDLLKETYNYSEGNGQVDFQFNIDRVTLKKFKDILADNITQDIITPPQHIGLLLFEELKIQSTFSKFSQALSSTFNQDASELPKPSNFLSIIKDLAIKQTLAEFLPESSQILDLVKESCEGEGELSINLRDIFVKVNFDLNIENAFDLLL